MKGRYRLREEMRRETEGKTERDLLHDYHARAPQPFRSKWTLVQERRELARRGWKGALACCEDGGLSQDSEGEIGVEKGAG